MRLVSFRTDNGQVHVGALRGEQVVDLSVWLALKNALPAFDMVDFICMGREGLDMASAALQAGELELRQSGALLPLQESRLLSPLPRPRKNIMCLGRNYAEHGAESRRAFGESTEAPPPEYPAIFTKAPTTVIGPYEDIPYDAAVTTKLDWECELAVIIGKQGKNIERGDALSYVFGYTVLNDISARDLQRLYGGQFFKGKSLDGTCPLGPWIVTTDEITDAGNLELSTYVNGAQKQHANTSSMLLDVPSTVASLSIGMTLEPGDIIATGTPAGVGHARTPPEFLQPGDVVECRIDHIGAIRNRVARNE